MDVVIMTTNRVNDEFILGERNIIRDLVSSKFQGTGITLKQSEKSKTEFLEILGSKYIDAILSRTSVEECSANKLSNELKIPLATVYRKIKLLEEAGLIENIKTIINNSGNEEKFYRCLISEATVNFHDGKLSVKVEIMSHANKISRLWKRFKKSGEKKAIDD